MLINAADAKKRLARIEEMVEEYQADQRRQLLQQVTKLRRLAEALRARVALEDPPRVH
jgi:hypothetical protein